MKDLFEWASVASGVFATLIACKANGTGAIKRIGGIAFSALLGPQIISADHLSLREVN